MAIRIHHSDSIFIQFPKQFHQISAAFNQIFVASGGVRNQLDVVSFLKLWILLNRENVSQSDESAAGTSSSGDSPAILLSQESIEHIFKGLKQDIGH